MNTPQATNVEAVRSMTNREMVTAILDLIERVSKLEAAQATKTAQKVDMTDEHARRVLNGDLADKKHKDAAEALGLSYGQVYSCRLEFTFKDVHKELKASGWKNGWVKA